jgi:hypothetical protein
MSRVADGGWTGSGPVFAREWGGRSWSLNLADRDPGLRISGDDCCTAKVLALDGLARTGGWRPDAFDPSALVSYECHQGRVQAIYAPPDWGGLVVRASWGPATRVDAIDLEVQIGADSVDELRAVEVGVLTDIVNDSNPEPPNRMIWVEPRDAASAALSYDGREAAEVLRDLWTRPVLPSAAFRFLPGMVYQPRGFHEMTYVELARPADVARKSVIWPMTDWPRGGENWGRFSERHALFGHDLEKGVIVRARLRACWFPGESTLSDCSALLDEFLAEPPPLGP